MKRILAIFFVLLFLTACQTATEEGAENGVNYVSITMEEAVELMDAGGDYIILDVREQDEYDAGHIPGAILIPNGQITSRAEQELPDKGQLILVYCRSGRRSKEAAQKLADLGYTNVKEFGGIIDWPYETE